MLEKDNPFTKVSLLGVTYSKKCFIEKSELVILHFQVEMQQNKGRKKKTQVTIIHLALGGNLHVCKSMLITYSYSVVF